MDNNLKIGICSRLCLLWMYAVWENAHERDDWPAGYKEIVCGRWLALLGLMT